MTLEKSSKPRENEMKFLGLSPKYMRGFARIGSI